MKTLALSIVLLAVAAAGPALGGELQTATSEMNNADASSDQTKTALARNVEARTVHGDAGVQDLYIRADRLDANLAEKKQLRAVQSHEEAGAQQSQFQIQMRTSDLQNAENVR